MKHIGKKERDTISDERYLSGDVAPTGIEPVFHAWEACVLAARRKRHLQSQILVSGAEAGGFEPPVRLPARQFSKLVVSATHPNFLLLAFRSNRCPSFCQLRCKGRCFSVSSQVFPSFFFLFPEIHGSLITYFSRAMNHRPTTHG